MPLRDRLQDDPQKNKQLYEFIFRTVARSPPGTGDPKWVKVKGPDGREGWISYTAMPAWHKSEGGPLDDYHVKAATYFLMLGNKEVPYIVHHTLTERDEPEERKEPAWMQVSRLIAKAAPPALETNEQGNFSSSTSSAASSATPLAPSVAASGLTSVRSAPGATPPTSAVKQPKDEPLVMRGKVNVGGQEVGTAMPNFSATMTDEERDLLVRYLMGPK